MSDVYPEPQPFVPPGAGAPCGPPAPVPQPRAGLSKEERVRQLEALLVKYEITIAEVNDLVLLEDYEIVFLADDSGSMTLSSVPRKHRRIGQDGPSRWDELCSTIRLTAEIACCFDADGVDIYFLNRPPVLSVTSCDDPAFRAALAQPPSGGTPLTERFEEIVQRYGQSEKPLLLLVATDGQPSGRGGVAGFTKAVVDAVRQVSTRGVVKVQILACTEDEAAVGYLDQLDDAAPGIDVTDDYYSEREQVLRQWRVREFRRSDWVVKALLGPICAKYDSLDAPSHLAAATYPAAGPPPRTTVEHSKHHKKDDGCCVVL